MSASTVSWSRSDAATGKSDFATRRLQRIRWVLEAWEALMAQEKSGGGSGLSEQQLKNLESEIARMRAEIPGLVLAVGEGAQEHLP